MADLLFRSPHNTAAILFIDGGVRATGEQPLGGRKDPRSHRRVAGPDGASGSRTSPASLSVGTFPSEKGVRMAGFEPVSLVSGRFHLWSWRRIQVTPCSTTAQRGTSVLNGTNFSWSQRPRRSSGPPGASVSIIYSEHFVCKAASVFQGRQETREPPGIPKLTPEMHRRKG